MDNEELKTILGEINDLFAKHKINEVTRMIGILETAKGIYLLSATVEGTAKCLERHSLKKAEGEKFHG